MEVVSPAGLQMQRAASIAPRLDDLDGKTVGEVWNGVFKGDVTFPIIRAALKARFPNIRIVPYTEFHHRSVSDVPAQQREVENRIVAKAQEARCDALILGNGA